MQSLCSRCEVSVPSMRSLCHFNNRYAIVSLVTYSLVYRNPNDLWKVRLSPFPTSAILCSDRSDLWKVPRKLRSQHKIADVGKGSTIWSLQTLIGSIYSDRVAIYRKFLDRYGHNTRSQMWERGFTEADSETDNKDEHADNAQVRHPFVRRLEIQSYRHDDCGKDHFRDADGEKWASTRFLHEGHGDARHEDVNGARGDRGVLHEVRGNPGLLED